MRCIKIIYTLLLFIFISISIVTAQTPEKQKILIYYFNDESDTQNYRYYSYIIPDSLSVELKNTSGFEVTVLPVTFKYISSQVAGEERANAVAILTSRGKEVSANFSVIGSYKVEKNIIHIRTQICNIASGEIVDADETKEKIGALIYEIIDKITSKINKELQKTIAAEKEKLATSPYNNFYSSFRNIFISYSYNFLFLAGDWENIYNDTKMSTICIGIPFSKIYSSNTTFINTLYLAPTWKLFSTNNHDISHTYDTYLSVYMGGISFVYFYPLSPLIDVSIRIEPGVSYTNLYIALVEASGPFAPHVTKSSYDPFISAEINAVLYFYSVGFTGGINYNRVFYEGNDLEAYGINFGICYKL